LPCFYDDYQFLLAVVVELMGVWVNLLGLVHEGGVDEIVVRVVLVVV